MPEYTGNEIASAVAVVGGLLGTGLLVTVGRTIYRMVRKGSGEASV
jgi:hypothetical protein